MTLFWLALAFFVPENRVRAAAFFLFLTFAVSLAWSLVLYFTLRLKGVSQRERFWPGEWVTARWFLRNNSFLPAPLLLLSDSAGGMETSGRLSRCFGLGPFQTALFDYRFRPRTRGAHVHGPMTLKISDPLSLFPLIKTLTPLRSILVYPPLRMDFPALAALGGGGGIKARRSLQRDSDRVRGWKEYEPGDELRDIDPFASVRMDKPVVRLKDSTLRRRLWVLLESAPERYPFRGRTGYVENAISLAAGLLYRNWTQGQAGGLVAPGTDRNGGLRLLPDKSADHLGVLMEVLARLPSTNDPSPVEERLTWFWGQLRHGDTLVWVGPPPDEKRESELFCARRLGIATLLLVLGTERVFYDPDKRLQVQLVEDWG